jgi:hypothetical protein
MFALIQEACGRFLSEFRDFWLAAALTDSSYEEGGTITGFRRAIASFEEAGLAASVVSQLRAGINNNLARLLESASLSVTRNRSHSTGGRERVDIVIRELKPAGTEALIECNLLYDCTRETYYKRVADDRKKLQKYVSDRTQAYQVVFFTQLPHFRYPGGLWYGKTRWKSREFNKLGIRAQYRHLMRLVSERPDWRRCQQLTFPSEAISAPFLVRRYDQIFVPDDPAWRFDANRQLQDCAVAVAIWRVG